MMSEIVDNLLPKRRDGPIAIFALAGLVAGYALFDVLGFWVVSESERPNAFVFATVGGMLVQPMLFGLWTALGPGAFLLRLPFVVAGQAIVLVVIGQVAQSPDDSRRLAIELLVVIAFCATLMWLLFTCLGRALLWWRGATIERWSCKRPIVKPQFRFDIKYMLTVMTVYAVVFALASRLRIQHADPRFLMQTPPLWEILIPSILTVGVLSAICLPSLSVPWIVLSPRTLESQFGPICLFWIIWTILILAIGALLGPGHDFTDEFFMFLLAVQFGAAAVGGLTALVLHSVGYRLIDRAPSIALVSTLPPSAPPTEPPTDATH